MIKRITSVGLLVLFLFAGLTYPTAKAELEQECQVLLVFNCKDKSKETYIKEIFEIDVKSVKDIDENTKNQIKDYLRSSDIEQVRTGLVTLFQKSVQPDWNKYIYGKSNKKERENLKKFFKKMEGVRQGIDREHSPLVNSWGLLSNAVSFGSWVTSTMFLDIQTQLPDVFGRFDYKDQKTSLNEKLVNVFTVQIGKPLRLDSINTINFNTIYYSLLVVPVLLYGLKILIDFIKVGYYSWESIFEVLKQFILFFMFIISVPYLVSFLTLSTNALNTGIQQSFTSFSTSDVCKDDRTLLCAYKTSFNNLASSEAIYAREDQIVSNDDDSVKYFSSIVGEFVSSFFVIFLYLLNILFGLAILLFWKGIVIAILINIMLLSIIAPFAMISPEWRSNWLRKLISNFVKSIGFVLVFNLATQLVLAVSTGGLAFWSISFVFILSGVLIFSSSELLSEVFMIDFGLDRKVENRGKGFLHDRINRVKQPFNKIKDKLLRKK